MVELVDNDITALQGERNQVSGLLHIDIFEELEIGRYMSINAMLQHVHLEIKRDKVSYLHAVLGFCPLSTLKQAITNGWIDVTISDSLF